LKRDDRTRDVKHGFVVGRFLLPPNQEPSEPIQPRVAPLHHPAARAEPGIRAECLRFVTARFDMQRVALTSDQISRVRVVVAFVSAEMLPSTSGFRTRTPNRKALQRGLDEPLVMRVGACHGQSQRNAASIGKKGTLCAQFAPICGVGARFFPLRAVPSSSLRPGSASPSRCLRVRRTRATPPSRAEERRLPGSTPGNIDATYSTNRTPSVRLSTDSLFAERRESRRTPGVGRREVCPRACRAGTSVEAARPDPTDRREPAKFCVQCCASPSLHPSRGGCVHQITGVDE